MFQEFPEVLPGDVIEKPKTLKQKWLDALRSGKYKQGTGAFQKNLGTFCALGVLADLIDNKYWKYFEDGNIVYSRWMGENFGVDDYHRLFNHISLSDAYVIYTKNDKSGQSFREIADYIEKNVQVGEV